MKTPESYMRQVLALAAEAMEQGEFPIASIVVLDDEIIARATTSEQREKRFLGHAELVALEEADKQHLSFAERGRARLFTNLEPCLMCVGAAMSFFLGQEGRGHPGLSDPHDQGWPAARGEHPPLRGVRRPARTRPHARLGGDVDPTALSLV